MELKPGAREITMLPVEALKPYGRNPRKHPDEQVQAIMRSIEQFGFTNPILVDDDNAILAGHGRLKAALMLGMKEVPVAHIAELTAAERRALIVADNQLAMTATWDIDLLASEIEGISQDGIDPTLLGFTEEEHASIERRGALAEEESVRSPCEITCPSCGHTWKPGDET
jgi:ParB-like chromosome segregation protein Spo0J